MKRILMGLLASTFLAANAHALTITINAVDFDFEDANISFSELYTALEAVENSTATSVLKELGVAKVQVATWEGKELIVFVDKDDNQIDLDPNSTNNWFTGNAGEGKFDVFFRALDSFLAQNQLDWKAGYDAGFKAGVASVDITSDNEAVEEAAYDLGWSEGQVPAYDMGYQAGVGAGMAAVSFSGVDSITIDEATGEVDVHAKLSNGNKVFIEFNAVSYGLEAAGSYKSGYDAGYDAGEDSVTVSHTVDQYTVTINMSNSDTPIVVDVQSAANNIIIDKFDPAKNNLDALTGSPTEADLVGWETNIAWWYNTGYNKGMKALEAAVKAASTEGSFDGNATNVDGHLSTTTIEAQTFNKEVEWSDLYYNWDDDGVANKVAEVADASTSDVIKYTDYDNGIVGYVIHNGTEWTHVSELNEAEYQISDFSMTLSEIQNDIAGAVEEIYNTGYDDGYADGYSDGYGHGFTDGVNSVKDLF